MTYKFKKGLTDAEILEELRKIEDESSGEEFEVSDSDSDQDSEERMVVSVSADEGSDSSNESVSFLTSLEQNEASTASLPSSVRNPNSVRSTTQKKASSSGSEEKKETAKDGTVWKVVPVGSNPGILQQIQTHYNIGDDKGGLLQTAFVLSYMVFAPVFGYLGDRYNRKFLMALGILLWSGTTLAGSFVNSYHMFLTFRALVGIGEASYSTIAPTIISDLFVKDTRSKMLALFYFAIPVGSGLGYIIGSETARATGVWQWGLRVTPIMGAVAVILILLAMEEPMRGESEGRSDLGRTSWSQDIRALSNNASFMLSTLGFTCVAFVAGALAWWGPVFIHYGLVLQPGHENATLNDVSYKFGIVAMISGLVGVPLGSFLAQYLRRRYPRVDPMICAIGLLISAPLLFIASLLADTNISICYLFIFFGEVFLNLNWSIVADILLYVVIPTRRSTAEAFQILLSHALGDAGSPYLIGVISEALKTALNSSDVSLHANSTILRNDTMIIGMHETEDPVVRFKSLQYALFTTSFVEVLGGLFFLITALYIIRDRKKAELEHQGAEHPQPRHLFADD